MEIFKRAFSVEGIGAKVCELRKLENRIEAGSDLVCKWEKETFQVE